MNRILACIDASSWATNVANLTAWAAIRLGASVELLHAVQRKDTVASRHDLSGAIGLGAKGDLLEELTRLDEAEGKLAIERGRLLLKAAKERLVEAGVADVKTLHRHGGIVETVAEREAESDLIVVGKRGASSEFANGHIGSKLERIIRASHKPVLMASSTSDEIRTVILAYDSSASANRAVELVAASPLFAGLPVHLVTAGKDDAATRSRLDDASEKLRATGHGVTVTISAVKPENLIAAQTVSTPGAILVMGAYGHSPLRSLIVGSTTTVMIRTVRVPVLMIH